MPLFDADNRLTSDACATRNKDAGNAGIADYTFAFLRAERPAAGVGSLPRSHPLARSLQHRNLQPWDGYGWNPAAMDTDSQLRVDSEVTHPRSKIQLAKRVFQAAPDLSHGQASPELELRLIAGAANTRKGCGGGKEGGGCPSGGGGGGRGREGKGGGAPVPDRLAERAWDRFIPGVETVQAENIIPPWTNGGAPSRDIARSDAFLRTLGYQHDGRMWSRGGNRSPSD